MRNSHTHNCKIWSCFLHLPKCLPIAFAIIYEITRSVERPWSWWKMFHALHITTILVCRVGSRERVFPSFQNLLTNPCDVGRVSLNIILVHTYICDDITAIIKTTKEQKKKQYELTLPEWEWYSHLRFIIPVIKIALGVKVVWWYNSVNMKAWKWKSIHLENNITRWLPWILLFYFHTKTKGARHPFLHIEEKQQVEVTKGAMNIYKMGKPLNPVTLLKHFHSFHNIIITTLPVIISLPLEWVPQRFAKSAAFSVTVIHNPLILHYLSGIFFHHCPLSGINKDLFLFQMRDVGAIQLYHY